MNTCPSVDTLATYSIRQLKHVLLSALVCLRRRCETSRQLVCRSEAIRASCPMQRLGKVFGHFALLKGRRKCGHQTSMSENVPKGCPWPSGYRSARDRRTEMRSPRSRQLHAKTTESAARSTRARVCFASSSDSAGSKVKEESRAATIR